MAAAVVGGAQSKGLNCWIKHFVLNDKELTQKLIYTWCNEQTFREIYLRPFEIAIKEATMTINYISQGENATRVMRAATGIMTSHNHIGATWAGADYDLLTGVVRGEWGYQGCIVTDNATGYGTSFDRMVRSGNDMWMGANMGNACAYDMESNTAKSVMRNAIHNIVYAYVNSNMMNNIAPGGYAYYEDTVPVRKYKKMVPLPIRRALGNLALHMPYFKGHNFLVKGAEIPEKSFLGQALVWPEREVDGVLKPEYNTGDGAFELAAPIYARVKGQPELVKKQYLDMNMWLPGDILLKADKMCMAHSLELRVPFLDRKVMEFAEHIPDRYRINENGNKQVLRHAANKSLPDEWATRPKVGFPVPIVYWLREQKWYDYVKEYFTAPWASEFFNTDELMHLLDLHFAGKGDFQRKIYTPLVFLVWYKRFFIDEGQPSVQAA